MRWLEHGIVQTHTAEYMVVTTKHMEMGVNTET